MDPVEEIIDAIASMLSGAIKTHKIVKYRTTSLSDQDNELPSIKIDFDNDAPAGGNFDNLRGVVSIKVDIVDTNTNEVELAKTLLEARRLVHAKLMQPKSLGLDRVIDVGYQGAAGFNTDNSSKVIIKEYPLRFQIAYWHERHTPVRIDVFTPGSDTFEPESEHG